MNITFQSRQEILELVKNQKGIDFNGYHLSMLERRIQKRILATCCQSPEEYLAYMHAHNIEIEHLIDVFTINVSHFFRNPLTFEIINKTIIPEIIKNQDKEDQLRIWSAGCSFGEEPYSLAILLNEYIQKEEINLGYHIFATDLDKKALKKANEGIYDYDRIKNVKYGILNKYFDKKTDHFEINKGLKKSIQFSYYDLLNKNNLFPPESIYGGFNLVLCRNVLIYFNQDPQIIIFNKLYKSLNKNGFLVLGESEVPPDQLKTKFKRISKHCNIYQKIG